MARAAPPPFLPPCPRSIIRYVHHPPGCAAATHSPVAHCAHMGLGWALTRDGGAGGGRQELGAAAAAAALHDRQEVRFLPTRALSHSRSREPPTRQAWLSGARPRNCLLLKYCGDTRYDAERCRAGRPTTSPFHHFTISYPSDLRIASLNVDNCNTFRALEWEKPSYQNTTVF